MNSVNLVILSNTAELVVDSGSFDHCFPLEFATQFELKEGRFLNASAANTIKLKHHGIRVVEGWTKDVNGTEIPLKIRFNVFDVKSHCCRRKAREFSLVADNPEKRHHDRADRPARVADTGTETLSWRGRREDVRRRSKRSARRHAEPQTLSDELTKSITCRTDLGSNAAWEEEEKKVLTSASASRLTMALQLCKWNTRSCTNTGDKDAKVTFLTMIDNSSGQMVATAVQKKGHVKFVERFLLKGLKSFGVTGDGASDRQRNGTDRCGKTRDQTDSQEKQPIKRVR